MFFTLFIRIAGVQSFLGDIYTNDGVDLKLKIFPQCTVSATKISASCESKDTCLISPQNNLDHISIKNDLDFVTFRLELPFDAKLLELEIGSSNRVFIPTQFFEENMKENPFTQLLPTADGTGAVKISFFCSFPLPPQLSKDLTQIASPSFEFFSTAHNLVFGHRGMGSSYKFLFYSGPDGRPIVKPHIENTIESFNAVAKSGGDGIEFDVLLTRDLVPIIYHDFYVCLRSDTTSGSRFVKVPIHTLTFEEIRSLQLYYASVIHAVETRSDLSPELFRLPMDSSFPTLAEMVEKTDSKLAFNLEVKYPQAFMNGKHECEGYHDRNTVANRIIEVLVKHAGTRPIVFTSFDFDSCLTFALKQTVWPVGVLTQGSADKSPPFEDVRTRTTESTAQFCRNHNFWGISAQSLDLLTNRSLINYIRKAAGITLMAWGGSLSDAEKAASLMPKGATDLANILITDEVPDIVKACK